MAEPAGATIFRKDTASDQTFMLLVSGAVQIEGTGETLRVDQGAGGLVLGEVGVLNPQARRTVTVLALEDCELLAWKFGELPGDLQTALTAVLEEIAFGRITNYTP